MLIKKQKPEEDSAPGAPAWMTTFSDCMTLLLTFFVLLLSFSSFDEEKLKPLEGAFECRPFPSIFDSPHAKDDSLIEEEPPVFDRTAKGAEKPSSESIEHVKNPKEPKPIVIDTDAYRDERVFYIPFGRLFLGKGGIMKVTGREYLKGIASFIRLMPCKVIISAAEPRQSQSERKGRSENELRKSLVVLQFFTDHQKIPADRLSLSVSDFSVPHRFQSEGVVRIVLLARDITQ